jgi:hypothetical protein
MMVKARNATRRVSHFTDEQRRAIDHARELLWPHFKGETVKLYVPAVSRESRAGRNQRIFQALCAGNAPEVISRAEGVALRTVQRLASKVRHFPP